MQLGRQLQPRAAVGSRERRAAPGGPRPCDRFCPRPARRRGATGQSARAMGEVTRSRRSPIRGCMTRERDAVLGLDRHERPLVGRNPLVGHLEQRRPARRARCGRRFRPASRSAASLARKSAGKRLLVDFRPERGHLRIAQRRRHGEDFQRRSRPATSPTAPAANDPSAPDRPAGSRSMPSERKQQRKRAHHSAACPRKSANGK